MLKYSPYLLLTFLLAYLLNALNPAVIILSFCVILFRLSYINLPPDEDTGYSTYYACFQDRGVGDIDGFWGAHWPIYKYIAWLYRRFGKSYMVLRYFDILVNILTLILTYHLCQQYFDQTTALWASLIYLFISSAFHLSVYSFNTEKYYYLFHLLGIIFLINGFNKSGNLYFFIAGIIIAIPIIIKVIPGVQYAIFLLYIFVTAPIASTLWYIAGGLLVLGLFAIYLWQKDGLTLEIFIKHYLFRMEAASYAHRRPFQERYQIIKDHFRFVFKDTHYIWVLSLSGMISLIIFNSNHSLNQIESLLILFFVSNIMVLLTTKIFHTYHYIPIVNTLGIGVAIYLSVIRTHGIVGEWLYYISALYLIISLGIHAVQIIRYRFDNTYRQQFLTNTCRKSQYFYVQPVAEYIKNNSKPEDKIFVWGLFIQLYILSDRIGIDGNNFRIWKPYTDTAIPIFESMIENISKKRPKFIVLTMFDLDMEYLGRLTGLEYVLDRGFFNMFRIYRIVDHVSKSPEYNYNAPIEEKKKIIERLNRGPNNLVMDSYYVDHGDFDTVFREVDRALEINPYDPEVCIFAGFASMRAGKIEDAKKWFYAECLSPNMPIVSLGRGLVKQKCGEYSEAIKYLFKELKKGCLEWLHFEIANTYVKMKMSDEALKHLLIEDGLYPSKPEVNYMLAFIYRQHDNLHLAEDRYKAILSSDSKYGEPFQSGSHYHLGMIYESRGENEQAKRYYHSCLGLNPEHKMVRQRLSGLTVKLQTKEDNK